MKIADLPPGVIDWSLLPRTAAPGETGGAVSRESGLGEIRLRLVEYGAGYLADHWCSKGHVLFVMSGALVIEHRDGRRYELGAGMSWHVGDEVSAPHRVVSERGATVFIVD